MSVNRDKVTILFSLCRKLQMQVIIGLFNYITSSVSELEKLNPALLLATRAGLKGILYSGLATVSHSPTRKWCFIHSYCAAVLCCAVLCCAVLCCAVLCCAVLCCAVLCCAVLCCAVLCCAVLCCAVLCCAVLCCAVLCCAVLCCAVLCCAVLCCAVLCFAQTVY